MHRNYHNELNVINFKCVEGGDYILSMNSVQNLNMKHSATMRKCIQSDFLTSFFSSVLFRSDVLEEGDYILSVNGVQTLNMKHDDIVNLLRTANDNILLVLQYELPDPRECL